MTNRHSNYFTARRRFNLTASESGSMMLEQLLAAAAAVIIAAAAVPAAYGRLSDYLGRFNDSVDAEASDLIINVKAK